ncbi:MAG TPA: rRNA maturation RNase YbeY [Verrucomicrobiae bacterium]|jgi:probable rRNA maturation factor
MSAVRFFNRQRTVRLERRFLGRVARALLEELLGRQDYELGVHFINAAEMARINQTFLSHEGSTDVITFDHRDAPGGGPLYGEIFISIDDALACARRFRVRWPSEVARYLVHGALHLEGFDDTDAVSRRVMKRRENKLLKELSARFDLSKMGRTWR